MNKEIVYPIEFEFKIMALAPQFYVRDANGGEIAYVKQKLFKLKEDITVFENDAQTTPIYKIKANKWIDWSASYMFTDAAGTNLGKMGRKGARSIWKATYEIFDENDAFEFKLEEANAFVKIMDGLFSEIPILGLFTGYVFNPKYNIFRPDGTQVAEFVKEATFFGKKFKLHQLASINVQEEERIILSLMMMVLLERSRG
ncbi:MAG: hypothetical protein IPO92_14095 [Saprospiraceae bacterium]|nr:hypothetical protein [Saprospiraceae bacterium]